MTVLNIITKYTQEELKYVDNYILETEIPEFSKNRRSIFPIVFNTKFSNVKMSSMTDNMV